MAGDACETEFGLDLALSAQTEGVMRGGIAGGDSAVDVLSCLLRYASLGDVAASLNDPATTPVSD
jgi:hypothetical protein